MAGLALASSAAFGAAPALRVDSSPVSDGRAGLVASYADALEPAQRAVVSIHTTKVVRLVNPILRQFFGNIPGAETEGKQSGLGSGVIVTPDGYILTNNHVVEGADSLVVSLSDDRDFPAKVVGTDPKTDIAVVKIEGSGLPALTLADSDKLRVGDIVFAVGNPLNVGETVTMGIVSAKGRAIGYLDPVKGYENFIQTDAAINLGNSGGALVDAKGRLVGINSAIVSPSRGSIGLGFAVPVNLAAIVMRSLVETGTVRRGYLGVEGPQVLTPDLAEQLGLPKGTRGVLVTDIAPKSPAEKAGLKSSDVILTLNGKPVATPDQLWLLVGELPPGATAELGVIAEGKPAVIKVVLGNPDDNPGQLFPGISVEPITDEVRQGQEIDPRINGLRISRVSSDSPYAGALAVNMVIVSINQQPVADLAAARGALRRPGRNLVLIYFRGMLSYITLGLPGD